MCGRYALALRPSRVRQMLQEDDLPVDEAPDDDEGEGQPRQSFNFAPGYHGIVYRASVPDWGAGPHRVHSGSKSKSKKSAAVKETTTEEQFEQQDEPSTQPTSDTTQYKLQSMKWGLIPFWTKRNPDYGSMLKTINCRDDSLEQSGGMWTTMKARKRCIVVAQGFYEWLKPSGGGRGEKIPHYVKRKDGKLMCLAGLWDCVRYEEGDGEEKGEGKRNYTYTIITTDSNPQLRFLHDRMPVILDQGSEELRRWLDPGRYEWNGELQELLRPYKGELEVYPVSKEVGKVGNNSPSFIIPVASKENKRNIANFFASAKGGKKEKEGGAVKKEEKKEEPEKELDVEVKDEEGKTDLKSVEEISEDADDGGMEKPATGVKRDAPSSPTNDKPPPKKAATESISPAKSPSPVKGKVQGRPKISATSNAARTLAKGKGKGDGSQKITKFFGNSS